MPMLASSSRAAFVRRATRGVVAALILALPAFAPVSARDSLEAAVRACARLKQSSERLACYDRKVAPLAKASGDEAAAVEPPSEEMFGLSPAAALPEPEPEPEKAPETEELTSITANVTNITTAGRSIRIELDNGHVWSTDEDKPLLLKPGDTVKISRAALGSFRLTTPTHRTARVHRVR